MTGKGKPTVETAEQGAATAQLYDGIVREPECRRLSGLSRSTRWRLEREGKFPKRLRISENAVGWLRSDLLTWLRIIPPGRGG
jgi:predicted DNA-binding transcriptional regulator AlpA